MASLNHQACGEVDPRVGHAPPRARSFQKDEKPYLGQEGDAHGCRHEGARVHHPDRGSAAAWPLARAETNETGPSCLIRTVHELAVPMREQLTSDADALI